MAAKTGFSAGGEVSAATPGVGSAYTLEDGRIEGGTIRFIDHQAGTDLAFDDVDAALSIPDFTGPASLSASAVTGGANVALTAEAGVFSAFSEGRIVPLTLDLTAGRSSVNFSGRAGWSPMAAEGALDADLGDLAAIAALMGAAAPDLPAGLGAEELTLAGQLTLDGTGAAYLRGATIRADGNTVTGDLDLQPGEARPKLSAQLAAPTLSLAGLSGAFLLRYQGFTFLMLTVAASRSKRRSRCRTTARLLCPRSS